MRRALFCSVLVAAGLLAVAPVARAATAPVVDPVDFPGMGPGCLIRATGSGFAPGTAVDVSLVPRVGAVVPLATRTADAAGRVTTATGTRIPFAVAPGAYTLRMTQPDGVTAAAPNLVDVSEPRVDFPGSLIPGQPAKPTLSTPTFFVTGLSDSPAATRSVTIDGRTSDVQWYSDEREFVIPATGFSAPLDLGVGEHEVTFTETGPTPYTVTSSVRVDPPKATTGPSTGTHPVLPLRLAPTAWSDDFDVTITGAAGDRHTGMRWTVTRDPDGRGPVTTSVTPAEALSVGPATVTAVSRVNGATATTTVVIDPATVTAPSGLSTGGRLTSADGSRELDMQDDGNLVERDPATGFTYWSSRTPVHPGSRLTMQSDGNAVIRDPAGRALWSSGTAGIGAGARFGWSATDAITVVTAGGRTAWSAFTSETQQVVVGTLPATRYLFRGQELSSTSYPMPPYAVTLDLQPDGDVVLNAYRVRHIWATHTGGHPNDYLILQSDGNLVVRAANGATLWSNGVRGVPGARVVVQSDGNLVEYAPTNRAVWSTRTHAVA